MKLDSLAVLFLAFIIVFGFLYFHNTSANVTNGIRTITVVTFKDGTSKVIDTKHLSFAEGLMQSVTYGDKEIDAITVSLISNVEYYGTMSSYRFTGKITVLIGTTTYEGRGVVLKTITIDKSGTSFTSKSDVNVKSFMISGSELNTFFKDGKYSSGNYYVKIQLDSLSLNTVINGNSKTYTPSNLETLGLINIRITYVPDLEGVTGFTLSWQHNVIPYIPE